MDGPNTGNAGAFSGKAMDGRHAGLLAFPTPSRHSPRSCGSETPGQFPARVRRDALRDYNGGMKILLNGHEHDVDTHATLANLLESNGYGDRRVAVEVNHEIVPRSLYRERALASGDRIEIVHAIGGG